VAGYFAGYFALSGSGYAYTNKADMVFMDTWPLVPGSKQFNSTLAHEFQHLVNYNHHYINYNQTTGGTRGESDLWLNEGLSSAAEYLYARAKHGPAAAHITEKIAYYKTDPYWDIRQGGNFVTWTPSWMANPYSSYSTVYLFFQWLRIHAGSLVVYQKISASPYKDYRAITNAVSSYSSILGSDWTTILNNWFIANALCTNSGAHGYGGDPIIGTLQTPAWRNSVRGLGPNIPLFPGEGVYIPIDSPPYINESPLANIKYTGLNTLGKTVDGSSPYAGDTLLAVNTTPQVTLSTLTPIPVAAPRASSQTQASRVQGGAASLLQTAPVPREPLPVDRVFRVGN
jgi:hypothetical protein